MPYPVQQKYFVSYFCSLGIQFLVTFKPQLYNKYIYFCIAKLKRQMYRNYTFQSIEYYGTGIFSLVFLCNRTIYSLINLQHEEPIMFDTPLNRTLTITFETQCCVTSIPTVRPFVISSCFE